MNCNNYIINISIQFKTTSLMPTKDYLCLMEDFSESVPFQLCILIKEVIYENGASMYSAN